MLQTGAKHYGLHLGPALAPQHETDPRILLEPNFYYPQEDLVTEFCKQTGAGWNVARPSFILGAVKDAAMNIAYPFGVYATVQAYLNKPLVYPGDVASFENTNDGSTARLDAYLEEWAVLTPLARNCDSSAFTWEKFWISLAGWYNVTYAVPDETTTFTELEVGYNPPPRG